MKRTYLISLAFILALVFIVHSMQSCHHAANQQNAPSSFQFKDKLSEYGFFKGRLNELQPVPALINYELSTPLFTDYTVKDRFIFLPPGKAIQYKADGVLDFPDSTIIIKNFAYISTAHKKIMIETRLLVKDPSEKNWLVMNYLWNAEQTDAIKHITGAKVPVVLLDDKNNPVHTSYYVPNTNDCKRCHTNNDIISPIGPKARNLNFVRHGDTANQLSGWAATDKISGLPPLEKIARLPAWQDSIHFGLSQRARAYLDVNCAHCHTKGGDAYNTGLFLEYQQSDSNVSGFFKSPVSAGGGGGGLDYDIIPGDAAHSILAYRMNSTDPGTAMPELARTIIHREGVQLITSWINQMDRKK